MTLRVMANSRNRRPTISPMKSSGIKTAMSDTVREIIVKPICPEPFRAASSGESPASRITVDILDHDDGIVHDEARGNGERHQGEIVERE